METETEERQTSAIRCERHEGVGVITLDRPDRFNSLDVRTAQDLRRAGLGFARDESIRCVVLRGRPEVFCSGVDLKYVRSGGNEADLGYLNPEVSGLESGPGAIFKQVLEYVNSAICEIRRAPKPFIAAVEGVAAAGGLGLALCCDLVIASERASFEWAYGKTGLSGAESATFLLPRLIGLRGALDLALLSPRLDADEALRRGLVSRVVPAEDFDAEVAALAERLAAGPTGAIARMKRLLNQAAGMDALDAHLSAEVDELVTSADSREFADGLDRFFAGSRDPDTS
ncbi:MAG: enoyl-CoA hydratase/isomerase family protein [Deltaproteobacteria bacterium]|nr:enoyl-CoA hydratase/isomerase family protein [Deltaproteobacteria bacterium]